MNMKLLTVAGRIRAELKEIERTAQRIPRGWQQVQETSLGQLARGTA